MNPMHAMTDLTLLRTRLYSLRPATLALLASGLVTPFLACETQDPRPGLGRDGGMVRTGGRSGSGTGSGGRLDFGGNDTGGLAGGGAEPGATGGSDPSGNGGEGVQTGGADGGGLMTRSCALAPAYPADFSKRALLESAGACSALLACRFSNAALQLGRHVTRYVENPSSQTQTAAQEAWTQAMTIWSRAAPAQYGPVASIGADSYHGRGIGAFIHAWPALNRCEVEKQVVTRAYQAGLDKVLPSARGLSALEYLLFVEGADTVCSANSSTAKAWAQLTPQEIAAAKRDYAQAVAEDLYLKSEELVSVWSPDGENFAETLAGHDGYGSQQEALNVVAWLADELQRHPRMVVLGDFNIAPDARDVHDPILWNEHHILTSTAEREALARLQALGLHDAFRLHSDEAGIFSWWDYRQAAFRRDLGLRIDLTLVSDALRTHAVESGVDREPRTWERPSDHAPAWVTLAG